MGISPKEHQSNSHQNFPALPVCLSACLALIAGLLAFAPLAEAEVFAPVLSPSTADSTVGIDVTIACDTPVSTRPTAVGKISAARPVVRGSRDVTNTLHR